MPAGVYVHQRSDINERFWSHVKKTDACWLWCGARNPSGYGVFNLGVGHGTALAHRFALILNGVEIPKPLVACHRCDVPNCVNPDHLFVGTQSENLNDSVRKGRYNASCTRGVKGVLVPTAKLDNNIVREIRSEFATGRVTKAALARRYGVARSSLWAVVTRKTWQHV